MGRGAREGAVKTLLSLLAAAAAFALLCLPARADFQICNRMSYVVEAAIGLQQTGALVTRGWYRVNPGQCRATLEGKVEADRFYVHARALPAYGTSPSPQAGNADLCVGKQISSYRPPAAVVRG
jgi:Predicted integral membrane protein